MTEDDETDEFGRNIRLGFALLGLILAVAALPLGLFIFVAVGTGMAHQSDPSLANQVGAYSLLLFPVLLFVLGIISLFCVNRTRLRVLGIAALLLFVDAVTFVSAMQIENRPRRPYPVSPPFTELRRDVPMVSVEAGKSVGVACSVETNECVSYSSSIDVWVPGSPPPPATNAK